MWWRLARGEMSTFNFGDQAGAGGFTIATVVVFHPTCFSAFPPTPTAQNRAGSRTGGAQCSDDSFRSNPRLCFTGSAGGLTRVVSLDLPMIREAGRLQPWLPEEEAKILKEPHSSALRRFQLLFAPACLTRPSTDPRASPPPPLQPVTSWPWEWWRSSGRHRALAPTPSSPSAMPWRCPTSSCTGNTTHWTTRTPST